MTDSQFANQFRREEEEKALAADRWRRLPSWERKEQEPEQDHDLPGFIWPASHLADLARNSRLEM
jgi:hypothetical protein